MKIDRSLWVVLAGAAAVSACYYVKDPPPAAPPPPPPPAYVEPPRVVEQAPPPTRSPSAERIAELQANWRRNHPRLVAMGVQPPPFTGAKHVAANPSPGSSPPSAVAPTNGGSSGGAPPSPASSAPAAPTGPAGCLDETAATVPACALKAADASCKDTSLALKHCQSLAAHMSPRVATAAVACLNALPAKLLCDPAAVAACTQNALSKACPDPETVAPVCQIATGPCKVSQDQCVTNLSGLSDQGQEEVAQCVSQGCTGGLAACIAGLGTAKH